MSERTPSFPLGQVLVFFVFLVIFAAGLLASQPTLSDAQLATLTANAVTVAATVAPATVEPTAVAVVPTENTEVQAVSYTEDEIKQGHDLFEGTCFACHGTEGQGIPGLGKNLTTSTFVHGLTDAELVAFIATGRPVGDPLNTTGVAMPARGANPSLTDDKLQLIVAYIRSQQIKYAGQATPVPTAVPNGEATATKPFVLPIQSMGLLTPTTTEQFVLPIQSLGLLTPTEAPTEVPTQAPTQATSADTTATASGEFVLPIVGMGLITPTATPTGS